MYTQIARAANASGTLDEWNRRPSRWFIRLWRLL